MLWYDLGGCSRCLWKIELRGDERGDGALSGEVDCSRTAASTRDDRARGGQTEAL